LPDGSSPDAAAPGVAAPQLSLPKGGGALRGIGESFSANPVNGTASAAVPIAISPGRGGFGPQLSLAYDSGAGAGPFGLGWTLPVPAITRRTDRGLPTYDDAAHIDVFLLAGGEDLVLVVEEGQAAPRSIPRTLNGVVYDVWSYRPRAEALFARIERWANPATASDMFWRTISGENLTTWYGRSRESRITDPGDTTLSEIFLPLEGRTASEVEQRARRLVVELRAGSDFVEAVKNNSPANRATRKENGKMGTFKKGEIKEDVAAAISPLKVGEVTEPIRLQDGFQIVRLDARKAPLLRAYQDPEVQQVLGRAVTMERAETAKKKYIDGLRENAFIKITKGYVTAQAPPKDAKQKKKDEKAKEEDAKALSGMSVLGNQEAPKALVIVPWKSSEIGGSLGITTMLDDSRQPIDKEVFMRVLSYYEVRSTTTRQDAAQPAAAPHRR